MSLVLPVIVPRNFTKSRSLDNLDIYSRKPKIEINDMNSGKLIMNLESPKIAYDDGLASYYKITIYANKYYADKYYADKYSIDKNYTNY